MPLANRRKSKRFAWKVRRFHGDGIKESEQKSTLDVEFIEFTEAGRAATSPAAALYPACT